MLFSQIVMYSVPAVGSLNGTCQHELGLCKVKLLVRPSITVLVLL